MSEIGTAVAALAAGELQEAELRRHIDPLFSRVLRETGGHFYLVNHSLGRPLDRTAADVEEGLSFWYGALDRACNKDEPSAPHLDERRVRHDYRSVAGCEKFLNEPLDVVLDVRPRQEDLPMHLGKRSIAEFLGTFWLVFGGYGSAVLAAAYPQMGIGFLGVALAFGLTVVTMAYAVGHISGAHFNPAITLGLWAGRRIPLRPRHEPAVGCSP